MSMSYSRKLSELIRRYVGGKSGYREFARAYSRCFVDEMPDGALGGAEYAYFDKVHERIEWTAFNPPATDRSLGWWDFDELREWLKDNGPPTSNSS